MSQTMVMPAICDNDNCISYPTYATQYNKVYNLDDQQQTQTEYETPSRHNSKQDSDDYHGYYPVRQSSSVQYDNEEAKTETVYDEINIRKGEHPSCVYTRYMHLDGSTTSPLHRSTTDVTYDRLSPAHKTDLLARSASDPGIGIKPATEQRSSFSCPKYISLENGEIPLWYHGNISRAEAERRLYQDVLLNERQSTSWLIREKERDRLYALSILFETGQIEHFLVASVFDDRDNIISWSINNVAMLSQTLNQMVQILRICPFTSRRITGEKKALLNRPFCLH